MQAVVKCAPRYRQESGPFEKHEWCVVVKAVGCVRKFLIRIQNLQIKSKIPSPPIPIFWKWGLARGVHPSGKVNSTNMLCARNK